MAEKRGESFVPRKRLSVAPVLPQGGREFIRYGRVYQNLHTILIYAHTHIYI